jgi:two-component sensor histidine kinase
MSAPPDIFITEELFRRSPLTPNFFGEKQAMQELAANIASGPEAVLPRFVDLAMQLTGGVSAGLSLYEPTPHPGVFRWRYLQGSLAAFENALTPRDFSPCGVTLDRNQPVLSRHPERYYTWISDANIVVPEVMLVPLHIGGDEPIGTLWIVSDSEDGHFNEEHARVATELASFVGIALKMMQAEASLQVALKTQEMLTKEMIHRVKNFFAISQGLVRLSAKSSASKEDLVTSLSNRFDALAAAHSLTYRGFADPGSAPQASELIELLQRLFHPYEHSNSSGRKRVEFAGPIVRCGEHALNALALVFNELVTNAVKHGSLAIEEGAVDLRWNTSDDCVTFTWQESGGRQLSGCPADTGFGEKLLVDTIERQLMGSLRRSWPQEGLQLEMTIPTAQLSR